MLIKKLKLINKLGLHARAAAKFVHTSNKYKSEITIAHNSNTVNGKSIMGLLMLAAPIGSELELKINGEDEEEMMKELSDLLDRKFDEDE